MIQFRYCEVGHASNRKTHLTWGHVPFLTLCGLRKPVVVIGSSAGRFPLCKRCERSLESWRDVEVIE